MKRLSVAAYILLCTLLPAGINAQTKWIAYRSHGGTHTRFSMDSEDGFGIINHDYMLNQQRYPTLLMSLADDSIAIPGEQLTEQVSYLRSHSAELGLIHTPLQIVNRETQRQVSFYVDSVNYRLTSGSPFYAPYPQKIILLPNKQKLILLRKSFRPAYTKNETKNGIPLTGYTENNRPTLLYLVSLAVSVLTFLSLYSIQRSRQLIRSCH